jgi:hypothetical protein
VTDSGQADEGVRAFRAVADEIAVLCATARHPRMFAPWRRLSLSEAGMWRSSDERLALIGRVKALDSLDRLANATSFNRPATVDLYVIEVQFKDEFVGDLGWLDRAQFDEATSSLLASYESGDSKSVQDWLRSSAERRSLFGVG